MRRPVILCALLLLTTITSPLPADDLQLATRAVRPLLNGDLGSVGDPGSSADGRFVVFETATALVGTDLNQELDVYLLDRDTGEVTLVSHSASDPLVSGNGESRDARISADGSVVSFESGASDLVSGVTDVNGGNLDIFYWRRATNEITLVSRAAGGGLGVTTGNDSSREAYLSADGNTVVFHSDATDFLPGPDANGEPDVFLWNAETEELTLISHAAGMPGLPGNGQSVVEGLSDDGNTVLVGSSADDLLPGFVPSGTRQLYLWSRPTDTFRLVTRSTLGDTTAANGFFGSNQLSADGGSVTFLHSAMDLVPGFVSNAFNTLFQWQESTGEILVVSHAAAGTTIGNNGGISDFAAAADGSRVVFSGSATNLGFTDENFDNDVFLWSRETEGIDLLSPGFDDPTTTADNGSTDSWISRDGSRVVFLSRAADLVEGYVPAGDISSPDRQIFLWQESVGGVELLSHSVAGPLVASSGEATMARFGRSGGLVLASSEAPDLVDGIARGFFLFDLEDASVSAGALPFAPPGLVMTEDANSDVPAISADGRFVVFESRALQIVEGFQNRNGDDLDIFLWDRQTGEVTLVSRSIEGPAVGGSRRSEDPQISGDGSLVVFESEATDLIPGYVPPNDLFLDQVYAWDRLSGEMFLLSYTAASAATAGEGVSGDPQASHDGGRVVFRSFAPDLDVDTPDTNGSADLFVWDRATSSLDLISRGVGGESANGRSDRPRISENGETVVFESTASDLVVGTDNNFAPDIFLWDQPTDTISLVSHVPGDQTTTAEGGSFGSEISDNGESVTFISSSTELVPGMLPGFARNVFYWTRQTSLNRLVSASVLTPGSGGSADSFEAFPSADGSSVVFESKADDLQTEIVDTNGVDDAFHWDRDSGVVTLISRSVVEPGFASEARSDQPRISADGERVIFPSLSTDLVDGIDTPDTHDLFVWERSTGTVRLVSQMPNQPMVAGVRVGNFAVSRDGFSTAFESRRGGLVSGQLTSPDDHIYVTGPPSSADLRLTVTAGIDPAPVGEIYAYEIGVENLSDRNIPRILLFADLPSTEAFVDATGPGWSCFEHQRRLSCGRGGLLAGGETAEPLTVRLLAPNLPGSSSIRAVAAWPGADPDFDNNIATAATTFAADDWGDAPDPSYPTLAASNGASHGFGALFLGAAVDVDVDGQPTADADGDEGDGSVDEDGVTFNQLVIAGQNADVEIVASGPGLLDAWLDWNRDGDWDDPGERVFSGETVVAGAQTLVLSAPADGIPGSTFARFRLSSAGIETPTGRAVDGEVEDYALTLQTVGLEISLDASPSEVPEVGGPVTFTVQVDNPGTLPVGLSTLTDDQIGDLNGVGTCVLPQAISPAGSYQCSYELTLGGEVGSTETHTASAGASSAGLPLVAEDSATVTFFDSIAPSLLGFDTIPGTDDGQLLTCETVRRTPQRLLVRFDETLATGAGEADDPASYRLLTTGEDLSFETADCGTVAASDVPVAYDLVYIPGAGIGEPSVAQWVPVESLADGLYRLLVCDGLEDLNANPLPGGDVSLDFRVDDGNLLRNGFFDCDLTAWEEDPPLSEVFYDPVDSEGSPLSGSLRFSSGNEASLRIDQCVETAERVDLSLRSSFRFDAAATRPVGLAWRCDFFAEPGCVGFLDSASAIEVLFETQGEFVEGQLEATTPAGTRSMSCGFDIEAIAFEPSDELGEETFDLYLDRAVLEAAGALFADGFESGDTSAWTLGQP